MYSSKQINDAVSTVHENSRRQAKRNLVTNYANGDINFIGDCFFAYSGIIDIDNNDVTLLNFVTGPSFLKGELHINNGSGSGDDMRYYVYFNDEAITQIYAGTSDVFNQFQFPLEYIIPPFTKVLITGRNVGSGSLRAHNANLTGKVYSGAEIIQGAI